MAKRLALLIALSLLVVSGAAAQGVEHAWFAWSTFPSGALAPIPGAQVTVCAGTTLPPAGTVCSPTTIVYTGPSLSMLSPNPLTASSNGTYQFWTPPATSYVVSVSGVVTGVGTITYSYSWTSALPLGSGIVFPGNNTFTGQNTFTGLTTFTGGLIANAITDTGLTVGGCVQAGPGGLLTTISSGCASGGGGGVTVTGTPTVGYPVGFTGPTSISNATALDGIQLADQAASLQAAINNCVGGAACEVYIPQGTNLPNAPTTQISITHTVWIHGAGIGQTIIKPTAALASTLFAVTAAAASVKFSDLTIDMTSAPTIGAISYNGALRPILENVQILYPATSGTGTAIFKAATGEMHARNVIMKGAGICVDINGDSGQEDFWTDIVCEDPGSFGYRLLRTTATDVGGQYLTHFKVTNPDARTTNQAYLLSSTASFTGEPFFCIQCVGDGMLGGHTYQFHNMVNLFLDSIWATNSASAGSNFAAVNIDNSVNIFLRFGYLGSASRDLVLSGSDTTIMLINNFYAGAVTNIYAAGSTLGDINLVAPVFSSATPMSAADRSLITNATNNNISTNGWHVAVSGSSDVNRTLSICNEDVGEPNPCVSFRTASGGGLDSFQILNNNFQQIFSVNQTGTVATLGASQPLTQTIATGNQALGTLAIAAGACATTINITAPGVQTTDSLSLNANSAPSGGYASLTLSNSYLAAGQVNLVVCNPTAAPITPGAETMLWRVVR